MPPDGTRAGCVLSSLAGRPHDLTQGHRTTTQAPLVWTAGASLLPERAEPMRVLRCPSDTHREIESTTDPAVAQQLARQVEFMSEDEGEESLTVVMVEPGDTVEELDAALNHYLLMNDYSGRSYVDPGLHTWLLNADRAPHALRDVPRRRGWGNRNGNFSPGTQEP